MSVDLEPSILALPVLQPLPNLGSTAAPSGYTTTDSLGNTRPNMFDAQHDEETSNALTFYLDQSVGTGQVFLRQTTGKERLT